MLLCADGYDCGFLFVPSYLLYSHFGDVQYNNLPPEIAIIDFGVRYCFQEQEHF